MSAALEIMHQRLGKSSEIHQHQPEPVEDLEKFKHLPKFMVCKEHATWSYIEGAYCYVCSMERRATAYQAQKNGTYKYVSCIPESPGFESRSGDPGVE